MRKIALITGATRGIGRALSIEMSKKGFHILALGRSKRALESLDDEIRAFGGKCTLVPQDLRNLKALDHIGPTIADKYGRLDIFIANAGILGELMPLHQYPETLFDDVMKTNFLSNWHLIRTLHPLLIQSPEGQGLFLTSRIDEAPKAYWGPYAASKAALTSLVRTYKAETKGSNLRLAIYNPGATATQMRAKAMPGETPETLPTPQEKAIEILELLFEKS